MTRKYLEFSSGSSNKFWTIELQGKSHTVTFGRLGTDGQGQIKEFNTDELAKRSFDKLVSQKLKKGYKEKKWKQPSKTVTKKAAVSRTKSADRFALDEVFKILRKNGILCLHNVGYTLSDGYEDAMKAYDRHRKPDQVIGFCFYHRQDSDGAKRGGGLCLAFGTARAKDEKKFGVKVGQTIRDELVSAGFKVVWNGKLSQRLCIPAFVWYEPTDNKKSKVSKKAKPSKKKSKTSKKSKATKKKAKVSKKKVKASKKKTKATKTAKPKKKPASKKSARKTRA